MALCPARFGRYVTVNVTNTGSVAGTAVVQVYISVPPLSGIPTPRRSLQVGDDVACGAWVTLAVRDTGIPRQ